MAGPCPQTIGTNWGDRSTVNTFPRGLQNDTEQACYRNATLVLFFHTPLLLNWAAEFVAQYCCYEPSHQDEPCAICLFHVLAEGFWSPDPAPRQKEEDYMHCIGMLWRLTKPDAWKEGEQQDVREYMECVLDCFDQEAVKRGGNCVQSAFMSLTDTLRTCEACRWTEYSVRRDPSLFLGGNIPEPGVKDKWKRKRDTPMCSMKTVVANYLRPHQLSGVSCHNCKKKEHMSTSTLIAEAPDVLFINVNRHSITGKVTTPIKIEMNLELSLKHDEGNSPDSSNYYELYGILFHIGNCQSGHYTAFVKGPGGRWMLFDDENRQYISPEKMEKEQDDDRTSYIFAYRKRGQHLPQAEPEPLDHQALGYEQASGYETAPENVQEHHVGALQSSGEIGRDPAEPVSGSRVWLEGTIKIDARDIEGYIVQQLILPSRLGPLVKQTKTRSSVQQVEFSIILRADDSDVVLEGTLKGTVKLKKHTVTHEQDTGSNKSAKKTLPTTSKSGRPAASKKRKRNTEQPEIKDQTSTATEPRLGAERSTATAKSAACPERKKGLEQQDEGNPSSARQTRSATGKSGGTTQPAAPRKRKRENPQGPESVGERSTAAKRAKTTTSREGPRGG